jgi:hypothetical protein
VVAYYKRFPAPARPIPAPRDKAPGLGSTDSEEVPQETYRYPLEEPHHFTGIKSRSRFAPEPMPSPVGHGGPTSGVRPQADMPEPNLETQFDSQAPQVRAPAQVEGSARQEYAASLGQRTPFLEAIRALVFVRSRRPGGETPPGPATGGVGGGINRASDLIRWSDFGVIAGKINRRFTLRREFAQDAQTFLGARLYQARKGAASTSPVSMLPPRVSRLTDRRLPGSFGQTTEVLEG